MFDGLTPSTSQVQDEHSVAYWKALHEKLAEQFAIVKHRNEELEERMLNVVEKVENDKAILSEEIDDLARFAFVIVTHVFRRLAVTWNRSAQLERDCARYKEDCMLAVHLLHCDPSAYVSTRKDSESHDDARSTGPPVRASFAMGTFPPTGVYMPEEEEEEEEGPQPEDPKQPMDLISPLAAQTATLTSRPSFTSQFVEKIRSDNEYSCVSLLQCKSCGRATAQLNRGTQTEDARTPMAVVAASSHSEPAHVLAFSRPRSDTSEEPFI